MSKAGYTSKKRAKVARDFWKSLSDKERSAIGQKAAETRKRNAEGKKRKPATKKKTKKKAA